MTATRGMHLARLAWPLAALSLFGLGVTALLTFTTLWETPDTNCGQLLNPTGGFCDAITDRRATWVSWTGALTVVAIVLTVVAFRGRRAGTTPLVVGLLAVALGAGLYGTWLLANGSEAGNCGSTLSRVDPFGAYSSARPGNCAPAYRDDRRDAAIAGGIAAVAFLVAAITAAPDRRRSVRSSP